MTSLFFKMKFIDTFVSSINQFFKIIKLNIMKSKSNKINVITFLVAFIFSASNFSAQNSITINSNKGKSKISISNSRNDFKIEYDGEIILTDDDSDIKDISRGGYIEIKKSSFGKRRKIIIEKDGSKLVRKFYVGWSEKNYYPDGKEWLKDILPEILRATTIGAQSRVDRFYTKGGAKEVITEIREMDSDYVKSAYFKLLLKKSLSANEITSTLQAIGKNINSDHYLSSILRKNQRLFLKNPATIDAYIGAAKRVNSDHYLTQIVKSIVANKSITDNQLESLLKISSSINSDHYLSNVLKEVMDKRELNTKNMEQVMLLSKSINSDHYKTNVLKKALKMNSLSKEAYNTFIDSLDDINSDHYATEVIKELMKNKLDSERLNQILSLIQKNIGSNHYSSNIYKKMANRSDLTENQLINVLNALKSISSSHDLSSALIAFAPRVKKSSSKVKDAYTNTAKSINSDTYLGRALKAIY